MGSVWSHITELDVTPAVKKYYTGPTRHPIYVCYYNIYAYHTKIKESPRSISIVDILGSKHIHIITVL